jgi:competence protein ComEA
MKVFYAIVVTLFLSLVSLHLFAAQVDINSADATTLSESLKGVGPKLARAIVDYRNKNGSFKTVDDLADVKGVGPSIIKKNREKLSIGKPSRDLKK